MLLFNIKWYDNEYPDSDNTADLDEATLNDVYETLKALSNSAGGSWEPQMWNTMSIGQWLELIVESEVGHTVYVPYLCEDSGVPSVVCITRLS